MKGLFLALLSLSTWANAFTVHPSKASIHRASSPSRSRTYGRTDNDMVDFMEDPSGNTVGDNPDLVDDFKLVEVIARAADLRKADDIVAMEVAKISTMCSYLVICSGNSRPQNQAIIAAIVSEVADAYGEPKINPEGTSDSGWMILDYGSVMVHVMTPKSRLYYNVEGQWKKKGGVEQDLSHVLLPNAPLGSNSDGDSAMTGLSAEDDPFWS